MSPIDHPSPDPASTSGDGAADPAAGSQQLTELLAEREAEGFTHHFGSRPEAVVRCFTCHHDTPAAALEVVHIDRLEGASDPDDLLAVLSLTCPACRTRGTLVCGYGPNAGEADAEVLQALPPEDPHHRSQDRPQP